MVFETVHAIAAAVAGGSSELETHKTVMARFWPWLSDQSSFFLKVSPLPSKADEGSGMIFETLQREGGGSSKRQGLQTPKLLLGGGPKYACVINPEP